jgi:hypothetical protein
MRRLLGLVALCAAVACGSVHPGAAVSPGPPLSVAELEFRVMDTAGKPVYCDRDYYPIARQGGEQENAIAQYPQIRADAALYAAIIAHEHLPAGNLTDDQKLTVYRAWKLLQALSLTQNADGTYSFHYRVQKSSGSAAYVDVMGVVTVDGNVTVKSQTPTGPPMCPICLSVSTMIATPGGEVKVTEIVPGMLVWTAGLDGARLAVRVLDVGSTPVPPTHMMVHVVLADGRSLQASPGHRTADGRALGTLAAGDFLDGSTITKWELVPYAGGRTYDLLPAGPTGEYWADGILLASTLAAAPVR